MQYPPKTPLSSLLEDQCSRILAELARSAGFPTLTTLQTTATAILTNRYDGDRIALLTLANSLQDGLSAAPAYNSVLVSRRHAAEVLRAIQEEVTP